MFHRFKVKTKFFGVCCLTLFALCSNQILANTGEQMFACSSWKRINLELKIPNYIKDLLPNELGKPFILTKSREQLQFKNEHGDTVVVKYAGDFNSEWSWYRFEVEDHTEYYLVKEVDGNIELNSIMVMAETEYRSSCSK